MSKSCPVLKLLRREPAFNRVKLVTDVECDELEKLKKVHSVSATLRRRKLALNVIMK